MGFIAGDIGVKAILEVFLCLSFYCGSHGSRYIVSLVAGDIGIKAAVVVFNLLSADFFGGGAGGFYLIGTVHALGEGDFLVCAVIGFAHNAGGQVFGDIEVFGTFNYNNHSFFCILADDGVLVLSVHCCVYHGEGAVVIANHSSGDVLAVWYCVITQVLDDFFPPYGGISCGIYAPFIGSDGDRAAVFIEKGFCRVFHTAIRCKNFGCHIARINLGIVVWFASQSNMIHFEATGDCQIFGGDFPSGIDIVSIDIAGGCNGTTGFDITTVNFTILGIQAGAGNGAAADSASLGTQAGAGNGGAANGITRNIS